MFVKHRQNSCWGPSIDWNNRTYLISQRLASEHSVQAHNVFLPYGSTRVTCRNTLLNDFYDRCFVLKTCFHCQYYCIYLCVQLKKKNANQKKLLECEFWHVLSACVTTLTNSNNFKNGIMGLYTIQAKYLCNKLRINFPCRPLPLKKSIT